MVLAIQRGLLVAEARTLYQTGVGLISQEQSETQVQTQEETASNNPPPFYVTEQFGHFFVRIYPKWLADDAASE